MTSKINSGSNAKKLVSALVLVTCLNATNPSFACDFNLIEEDANTHTRKKVQAPPSINWGESSAFRISGQRFSPTRSGWNPEDDDFGFDVDVKTPPVNEYIVEANVVSIEKYKPRVFVEDLYLED